MAANLLKMVMQYFGMAYYSLSIGTQYDPSSPVDSAKLKNEINIQKDVLAQQAIEVTHQKAEATAKEFVGKVFLYVKQRVVFYSTLTTRS